MPFFVPSALIRTVYLTMNVPTAIPNAIFTQITNWAVASDNVGGISNANGFIIPASGFEYNLVQIQATGIFALNGTGARNLRVMRNGVDLGNHGALPANPTASAPAVMFLANFGTPANAVFTVEVFQNSGAPLNLDTAVLNARFFRI